MPTGVSLIFQFQKLEGLLEELYSAETPIISSGTQSQSEDQFAQLWAYRELIPEAVSKAGKAYKYDISIPAEKFKEVVDTVTAHLKEAGVLREGGAKGEGKKVSSVVGYGHFGDGTLPNLWLN